MRRNLGGPIDWFVIFLLAGVIPLSIVMENTGTAQFVSTGTLQLTDSMGPVAVISVFYLVATLFSSIMSHNAAAILLGPIGIASAQELGLNPLPFLSTSQGINLVDLLQEPRPALAVC